MSVNVRVRECVCVKTKEICDGCGGSMWYVVRDNGEI